MATTTTTPAIDSSVTNNLSPWAGDYVTNMLGKGWGLSEAPYETYKGPLTAGASNLQTQAFQGLGSLTVPTNTTPFQTETWGTPQAQKYMTPYMETILTPQLDMARRQSQITNLSNNAAATKAGAYGGSRQALMTTENQRALGDTMAGITGKAYDTAYTTGMGQFNADQNRLLQADTAGTNYGLAALAAQRQAGEEARQIEQQALNAQKAQFEEERDAPYKMVQYQQSLLNGLPISAQTNDYADPALLTQAKDAVGTMLGLYDRLYGTAKTNTTA